jgi:hypothetical protein
MYVHTRTRFLHTWSCAVSCISSSSVKLMLACRLERNPIRPRRLSLLTGFRRGVRTAARASKTHASCPRCTCRYGLSDGLCMAMRAQNYMHMQSVACMGCCCVCWNIVASCLLTLRVYMLCCDVANERHSTLATYESCKQLIRTEIHIHTYISQEKVGREGPGPAYDVRMTYKGITLLRGVCVCVCACMLDHVWR